MRKESLVITSLPKRMCHSMILILFWKEKETKNSVENIFEKIKENSKVFMRNERIDFISSFEKLPDQIKDGI
jgi:hypothetical protein